MERKQTLAALRAIKLISVFLLFWWHSALPKPSVDIGARTCELFFVTSGFLVAYHYADRENNAGWKDSFIYLKKKICSMWPLHFICFLLCILLNGVWGNGLEKPLIAFINIFLLQSWINDRSVFLSYNGVSWFLSSILFCYFLSPFLLKGLKTKRTVTVSFFLILFFRLFAEYLQVSGKQYSVYVPFSIHTFPLIRVMEFYCGMTMYRFREYAGKLLFNRRKNNNLLLFSIAEILVLFGAIWLIITQNNNWIRGYYVIVFCCVVFVFSFNKGIISKITDDRVFSNNFFAKAIAWLASFEFEFFMLHQVMISYSSYLISHYFSVYKIWIESCIALVMTIAIAWIWKRWLSSCTTKLMQHTLKRVENWFGYSL